MFKIGLAMDCLTWKESDHDLIPLKSMSYLWNGKCGLQIRKVGGQELQRKARWFGSSTNIFWIYAIGKNLNDEDLKGVFLQSKQGRRTFLTPSG
jgi:hypothetical protein